MFDINKLALKIPNFLNDKECNSLITEFKSRENESYLEQSHNKDTNKHEASSFTVVTLKPNTENFKLIKNKTKEAINLYIQYLEKPNYFLTSILKRKLNFSHHYRIMKYATGAKIHPHSDHDDGVHGSLTFNLNEDYEGGEFKFFNGNYTIPLKKGDALIFPADYFWVHEVSKVTKGTRYSLNSFLMTSPMDVHQQGNYLKHIMAEDYIKNTPKENLLGPYN